MQGLAPAGEGGAVGDCGGESEGRGVGSTVGVGPLPPVISVSKHDTKISSVYLHGHTSFICFLLLGSIFYLAFCVSIRPACSFFDFLLEIFRTAFLVFS